MSVLEYRGYLGSVEVDVENGIIFGKLLYLRDSVTYNATSVDEIEAAFREAVDDYLATCEELGDEPDVPLKGSFNVRIGPDLHRDVALYARLHRMNLNDVIVRALDEKLHCPRPVQHVHKHEIIEMTGAAESQVLAWSDQSAWSYAGHGRTN